MLTRLARLAAAAISAAVALIVFSPGTALAGGGPSAGGAFGFAQCDQSSSPSCTVTAGSGPGNGTPGNSGTSGGSSTSGSSTSSGSGLPGGTSTGGGGTAAAASGGGAPPGCLGTNSKTFGCVPKGCTITAQTLACPIGTGGTAPAAKGKARPARPVLPAPGVLARLAREYLRLPSPQIRSSPAPAALQLTRLPVWLWVAPAAWQPQSKTASVPGESVTATASPSSAAWSMGNGTAVTCQGPGTPYTASANPAATSPTCGYTYPEPSTGQPGGAYPVTVTITWTITWKGPAGAGGVLAPLQTTARTHFRVAESQGPPEDTGLPAVIIPAADAARLLPGTGPASIPGISAPATFDAALSELESGLLTLARTQEPDDGPESESPAPDEGNRAPVLIAEAGHGSDRRLAGILETGRRTGVTVVMLGAWDGGATCDVAADGTVEAVSPPAPDLDGLQLYTLGAAEAASIVRVLQEAAGSPPAAGPHAAETAAVSGNGRNRPDPPPAAGTQILPAREAPALAAPAAELAPAAPDPAREPFKLGERPAQLSLLGSLRIAAGGEEISGGLRKARELLAYLAVHPDGASGEVIAEALWPDAGPDHATAQRNLALRKARDMLRAATGLTEPMWILNASGRYRLDPALIATDLQAFGDALDRARQAAGADKLSACRQAVALYRGDLADGEGYEWSEPYAETARRRALDAWTAIADILQPDDPDQALSALETALGHDAYNEYLYQRIMRLQAAAGRPEAVRRTLRLLEARLTEIDVAPSSQTRKVAASLLGAAGTAGRASGTRTPSPDLSQQRTW